MDLHFMEAALASDHFSFGKEATFPFMKIENWVLLLIKSLFYSKAEKSGFGILQDLFQKKPGGEMFLWQLFWM